MSGRFLNDYKYHNVHFRGLIIKNVNYGGGGFLFNIAFIIFPKTFHENIKEASNQNSQKNVFFPWKILLQIRFNAKIVLFWKMIRVQFNSSTTYEQ